LNGGVVVTDVRKGGPADKAGVMAEDVLLAMNGKTFKDGDDLMMRIADTPVGTTVDIEGERDGKKKSFKITIEDRMKVFQGDARVNPDGVTPEAEDGPASASNAKFGIKLVPLTDQDRAEMAFEDKRGVRVTSVEPDSFAEGIGLNVGDIIVSINRSPVASPDDVRAVQSRLKPGDAVAFRVMRGGRGRTGRVEWQGIYLSGTLPATDK
jgi:serine protease Do